MRRIAGLVAVAIVTSLAAAAASAQAAAPVHERIPVDEAFTFDACGFVVEERLVAILQFTSWYDDSGNRLRQVVTAPGARITWTNVATGASVTSGAPYAVHKQDNADGTLTVAFTGLGFVIPAAGGAYVSAGRALILFSPTGAELLAGAGPGADLCEALTAAIG